MKTPALILFIAGLLASPAFAQTAPHTAPAKVAPVKTPAKPGMAGELGDIRLTNVRLDDVARLLAQVGRANVVVTSEVSEKIVSLYLHNASVEDMVRNACRAAGVWYRFDPQSRTYVIMSAEEYQKDVAIVRDEATRVFTLRHHNVVAAANAVRALYGSRVQLSTPVEEAPPITLGSGTRTATGGSRNGGSGRNGSGSNSGSGNGNGSGGSGSGAGSNAGGLGSANNAGSFSGGTQGGSAFGRGSSGGAASYDLTADLRRLNPERLGGDASRDSAGRPVVGITDIQDMAARQGPPIFITYNRLNNLLIVRSGDTVAMSQIDVLLREIDRPPKQVLLEMKILEVTLDDGFQSIFDISTSGSGTTSGPLTPAGMPSFGTSPFAKRAATSNFDLEGGPNYVWQIMSDTLRLRFQLLAKENKLKALSSPMLVASNNQPARLFIGDERVLVVGASSQSVTGTTGATNTTITVETETRDIGQTLTILPRINDDRSISLTVDQDSSTVKVGDTTIPISTAAGDIINFPIDTVNTASLQATAHAQDGMTVAIGGMIRNDLSLEEQKLPIVGDIPVLGTLFKRDVRAARRSQIVLLITPRVLENPAESDALARQKEHAAEAASATIPTGSIVPKIETLRIDLASPAADSEH